MISVDIDVVGMGFPQPSVTWPDNWPVPREGDPVGIEDGTLLYVRNVTWYPSGGDDGIPFVYVVIGPRTWRGWTKGGQI